MDLFASRIEALEHGFMRAWMQRDRAGMKAVLARNFIFLLGASRPVILDRASWLEAATTRLACTAYRFGDVYVRRHGSTAVFSTLVTIEAGLDDIAISGEAWIIDLWQRTRIRRKWRLVERTLSRPDTTDRLPEAVRSLQLWRPLPAQVRNRRGRPEA